MDVLAVVANRREQVHDVVVVQLVADVAPVTAPADQPEIAQDP
jgi:hypothetical protein